MSNPNVSIDSLVSLFPPSLLGDLAVRHKVDETHEIRLPGKTAFLCLLNGQLNHSELTQRLLEERYIELTGKHADHSTFGKYLARIEPAYFKAVFDYLYDKLAAQATQGERSALRLRFVDATVVSLSAKRLGFGIMSRRNRGAVPVRHAKSVLELSEDGLSNFVHLCRTQNENSDCLALGEPMIAATQPGDLWIFDCGCHDRKRLLRIADGGGFWLTPHNQQRCKVRRIVFERTVANEPAGAVSEGTASQLFQLFQLLRVEEAVFENSYQDQWGKRLAEMPILLIHGLRYDARSRQWKPPVLITNLPLSDDWARLAPSRSCNWRSCTAVGGRSSCFSSSSTSIWDTITSSAAQRTDWSSKST